MRLPLFIARRYLFAKKSHNVINLISAISVAGLAIGTAALIVILSVYNGFDGLVRSSMGNLEPDILVSPSRGKVFVPDNSMISEIRSNTAVGSVCAVLEDNVYLKYSGKEAIARAKGIDTDYESYSPLKDKIVEGDFSFHKGDIPLAVMGNVLAWNLSLSPRFLPGIDIYYPDRQRQISLSNPTASLKSEKVWPSGLFSTNTESDNDLMLVPMEVMRSLLGYEDEISSLEIRLAPGSDSRTVHKLVRDLSRQLGPDFTVRDRFHQNETLYKMMRYEKAAVFLILIFVVIIVAFNIFGSLTMLIIEKEEDIKTFSAMGAPSRLVKRIFLYEGWMISLLGLAIGIVAGVALALIQQHFGIIKMPGNYIIDAYPVILKFSDVLLTAVAVAAIGYLIALLPVRGIKGLD